MHMTLPAVNIMYANLQWIIDAGIGCDSLQSPHARCELRFRARKHVKKEDNFFSIAHMTLFHAGICMKRTRFPTLLILFQRSITVLYSLPIPWLESLFEGSRQRISLSERINA